ncbi:hypothetical protein [Curtobacterium sp. MCBA15_004]|uniref:hypothetical protein n=1 Tax=unclassified Curtobacterium TaxID=257496 RepID=UPI001114D0A0|nr:hypothetical protein [Curtobacterium sp. MCBA15_004]WIA97408.1 hypothetical protein QOL16_03155 [Curtobacterium sp. MCBA15_004]
MQGDRRRGIALLIGVPLTAVLAAAVTISPRAILVLPAALALVLVVRFSWARAAFFMLGAFLVFQTSSGLSTPKVFYFAVVALSVLVSLARLRRISHDPVIHNLKPAYLGGLGIILWQLLFVLPYSVGVRGVSVENWLRDGATYVLIGCAVIIAMDAVSSTSTRLARGLVIAVGTVAAFSFASRWISARGLVGAADTDGDATLLSSLTALTLAVALAFTLALAGTRLRWLWLLLGVVFVLAILVTGTRTGVVFGAVLVGIVGSRVKMRAPVRRVLAGAGIGVAAVAAAIPITASFFTNEDFLTQRLTSIWSTIQNGVGSDQSGAIRGRAYEYCLQIWQQHLLLGRGEGWAFVNPTTGVLGSDFSVDSPLVYLAKFGIVGCLVLATCLVSIFVPLIRRGRSSNWLLENTAVRGCAAILLALLPFGATLEDKGFGITIALAVLLVGSAMRAQRRDVSDLLATSEGSQQTLAAPTEALGNADRAPVVDLPGRA